MESTHYFLDLPALADALSAWLDEREKSGTWRPNVIKFSQNFLEDIRPRAMTRDIDWGIPVPGWEDQPTKPPLRVVRRRHRLPERLHRVGAPHRRPRGVAQVVERSRGPVLLLHGQGQHPSSTPRLWPAELLGYNGQGAKGGAPGDLGVLNLPTEVVSSEFLTMEGKKFSSSHGIVIYVRDFLSRYQADALRYFISAAGPETSDSDFTWAEFVRRTNGELVAG